MLEVWVGCVGSLGRQREVVVQVTSSDVGGGLRQDFRALHGLAVPECSTILSKLINDYAMIYTYTSGRRTMVVLRP